MNSILVVLASPAGEDAYTSRAALLLADRLGELRPDLAVVVRDVAAPTLPHVGQPFIDATLTPSAARTSQQVAELELSRGLARELENAAVIIIGSPMINLGMPSTLKAWFDRLLVPGVTFSRRDGRPIGKLSGRKVVLVEAHVPLAGEPDEPPIDLQHPLMVALLAKMGLSDVTTIAFDVSVSDSAADLARFDGSLREIVRRMDDDLRPLAT